MAAHGEELGKVELMKLSVNSWHFDERLAERWSDELVPTSARGGMRVNFSRSTHVVRCCLSSNFCTLGQEHIYERLQHLTHGYDGDAEVPRLRVDR